MVCGERIDELLGERGISQSELARRVGLRQSTINYLVSGRSQGSKHLHKIARELGTTAEYLMGETDDPEPDAPAGNVVMLDSEARELLRLIERMSAADRRTLVQVARSMAKTPAESDTLHDHHRGYRGKEA